MPNSSVVRALTEDTQTDRTDSITSTAYAGGNNVQTAVTDIYTICCVYITKVRLEVKSFVQDVPLSIVINLI